MKRYAGRVVVFGPTVEYKASLPKLVALAAARRDEDLVDRNRVQEQDDVDALFKAQSQDGGVVYFSVHDALCPRGDVRFRTMLDWRSRSTTAISP